jgi:hypothetical protein
VLFVFGLFLERRFRESGAMRFWPWRFPMVILFTYLGSGQCTNIYRKPRKWAISGCGYHDLRWYGKTEGFGSTSLICCFIPSRPLTYRECPSYVSWISELLASNWTCIVCGTGTAMIIVRLHTAWMHSPGMRNILLKDSRPELLVLRQHSWHQKGNGSLRARVRYGPEIFGVISLHAGPQIDILKPSQLHPHP